MRVLQIAAAYKPAYIYGGPTMSVAMLCEQLIKAGCDVGVFATTANGMAELDVIPNKTAIVDGVSVTYFKRITKDHSHFSPALLKEVWKDAKAYDVIHIHAWWNLVSVLSGLIGVMRGVPVLVSARGTLSPYSFQNKNAIVKSLLHSLLGKPVLKRCHFHATSQRESDAVKNIIKYKSITTLPNFVKLPVYHPAELSKAQPLFRLLFFSRIEEKKGLDILINALPFIKVPFHLTIAGSGSDDYVTCLQALVHGHNLAHKITWRGFINEDKFNVLEQHDLFILPSHDENFGNAVIESLSVGTAVMVSNAVGLAHYVLENQLGWVCSTNPNSVSDTINTIAQDHQTDLKRIKQYAPGIIYDDFKAGNLVKRYINMYNTIINNG